MVSAEDVEAGAVCLVTLERIEMDPRTEKFLQMIDTLPKVLGVNITPDRMEFVYKAAQMALSDEGVGITKAMLLGLHKNHPILYECIMANLSTLLDFYGKDGYSPIAASCNLAAAYLKLEKEGGSRSIFKKPADPSVN